ncbi:hypothetical protein CPC16_008684 [Podila verticillata]|nr:hypothetical protein CPC16_008684 [Podila verticillata]
MSRQDSQETLFEPPEEQHLDNRHDLGSMAARVLNMRQRKWNSARKEWQEWHEVQATHAPELSSITSQHEPLAPQGTTEQMELLTDSISSSGSIGGGNTEGQLNTHPSSSDSFADPHGGDPSLHASRGKQTTRGQSNSLGRQRSLHDSRDRSKDMGMQQHLELEERHPVSTRTRSFSETHIYPYTQHHLLQLQQIQSEVRNPSPFYQMPIPQRAGLAFSHTDSQHHYGSHRALDTFSHPHHSHSNEMGSDRNLPSSGPGLHRLRHSQSGSSVSEPPHINHPWTLLTMTPLDGAQGPGPGTSSSRRVTSASPSPALSPTYGHQEELNSWTQQLLHSQGIGNPAHHNYFSPIHPYHGQHHGDDVAMGEETVARGLPSRSSSPSPCLSMVPTVNRPLSISFSQLVGSHMLEDLAEHDDDMEL